MTKKIKNIETLIAEKERLKLLCKAQEQLIEKKLNYMQDNLGIIALETILPINNASKQSISNVFEGIQGILQTFVPGFSEKFEHSGKWFKIIELIAATIFTRFFNQKSA